MDADEMWGAIGRSAMQWPLLLAALALTASHGISFVQNYLRGGEWRRTTLKELMTQPYRRVALLVLVVLIGGVVTGFLGDSAGGVATLILLKIVVDVRGHVAEHARLSGDTSTVDVPHDKGRRR